MLKIELILFLDIDKFNSRKSFFPVGIFDGILIKKLYRKVTAL